MRIQLTASIPASDLTTAGAYNITVFNPGPGGGESNALGFIYPRYVSLLAIIAKN